MDIVSTTFADNYAGNDGEALAVSVPQHDIEAYNCIVYSNGESEGDITTFEELQGSLNFNYSNVEYDGGGTPPGNNINENPLFLNQELEEYVVKSGSPSINSGLAYDEGEPYSDGSQEAGWMTTDTVLIVPDSGVVTLIENDRIDQGFWGNISGSNKACILCDVPKFNRGSSRGLRDDNTLTMGKLVRRDRYVFLHLFLIPTKTRNTLNMLLAQRCLGKNPTGVGQTPTQVIKDGNSAGMLTT